MSGPRLTVDAKASVGFAVSVVALLLAGVLGAGAVMAGDPKILEFFIALSAGLCNALQFVGQFLLSGMQVVSARKRKSLGRAATGICPRCGAPTG